MEKQESGILVHLPARSDSNGFLNRRSPVRIRPGSPGSTNRRKPSNHAEFICAAKAAGASDVGALRLERDLLAAGRRSGNLTAVRSVVGGFLADTAAGGAP